MEGYVLVDNGRLTEKVKGSRDEYKRVKTMKNKLDEQVDVSYLEDEKKQLQGQMQQVQGAKRESFSSH